jgi:hypothetical protein
MQRSHPHRLPLGQLFLFWAHLAPKNSHVFLNNSVAGVLVLGPPEPAIRERQVTDRAMTGCVHSTQGAFSLRAGMLSSSKKILLSAITISRDTISIKILFAFGLGSIAVFCGSPKPTGSAPLTTRARSLTFPAMGSHWEYFREYFDRALKSIPKVRRAHSVSPAALQMKRRHLPG